MDLIARIRKARVAWSFAAIAGAYWLLTLLVDYQYLRELLDATVFVLSAMIVGIYLPLATEEFTKPRTSRSGRLLISLVLIWLAMMMLRGLSIYGRSFDQLEDIGDTYAFGFILWTVMWAAILGAAAPSGDDELSTPYRYRTWIIVAIAAGCGIGGFFIGLSWQPP